MVSRAVVGRAVEKRRTRILHGNYKERMRNRFSRVVVGRAVEKRRTRILHGNYTDGKKYGAGVW